VRVEDGAGPHLLPVVVLRIDPEDRHGRDVVVAGRPACQLDRRNRLEQGEERSSEGAGLLAGDDRDTVGIREKGRRCARFRGCTAPHLLRLHDCGDRAALPRMLLGAGDGRSPRLGRGRVTRIKRRDLRKIPRVIGRERPGPGELPELDAGTRLVLAGRWPAAGPFLHVCHGFVLSQRVREAVKVSHRSLWTPRPAREVRVTFEGTRLEEFHKLSRDDPSAFAPPSAFGPFRVLHQVGVGALGPVFRTYEPTRDRLVAVKVFRLDITPEQAHSLADALAVAAEAGLFHPSIVEPIAAGVEGTVAYRAEEYVAAESLDVALRHYAPAAMSQVLPFVAQLAGAIDFARTAGICHGALHPRDIFVTPDEARATGFGVVEALERVGLRAPVRRPYSAPERVEGQTWGAPADVFSLAAITYELITARRPSGTGSQIGSMADSGVGRDGADLVHAVLAQAMHEDPRQRFQSGLEFAAALDAASAGRAPRSAKAALPAAAVVPVIAAMRADEYEANYPLAAAEDETDVADTTDRSDDVLAEQEADEADATLIPAEDPDRTLFDDEHEEALEDLALDRPDEAGIGRFADEFGAASAVDQTVPHDEPVGSNFGREPQPADRAAALAAAAPAFGRETDDESDGISGYRERDDVVAPHRTGPSWLAAALLVGLALLVGFVAGQMIDPAADPVETNSVTRSEAASAATPPTTPATSGSDDRAGAVPAPAAGEVPAPVTTTPAPAAADPEPPTPPAPRTGTLIVRSAPAGASVTLDGKWRGRTPLTLEDVEFGRREVRVVQQGYAVATEEVALSAGAPSRSLSFRLERTRPATPPPTRSARTEKPSAPAKPAVYTGTVYVDSLPRGAQVFVNGRAVGTTPLLVPEVAVGSQIVRLQLEDHRTWSTSVRVVAGQQVKVSGSLERIR
jgi:serine/threonine protein kinase